MILGEIPGKCSNFNYASREAVRILRQEELINPANFDRWLMTTGDCDTVFAERHFDTLESDFLLLKSTEVRRTCVWQSPLFYQMGIDKSPFFVRVTGLFRAYFMMGGEDLQSEKFRFQGCWCP